MPRFDICSWLSAIAHQRCFSITTELIIMLRCHCNTNANSALQSLLIISIRISSIVNLIISPIVPRSSWKVRRKLTRRHHPSNDNAREPNSLTVMCRLFVVSFATIMTSYRQFESASVPWKMSLKFLPSYWAKKNSRILKRWS